MDALRFIASIMVVLHHTAGTYLLNRASLFTTPSTFFISAFLDSATRIGVPLFIMISGRFLIDQTSRVSTFYLRRARRIIIPLIVWSIFYSLYKSFTHHHEISIFSVIRDVAYGTSYYHMWYLYMLTGLYIITPLIPIFTRRVQMKSAMLGILLLIFGMVINLILYNLNPHTEIFAFAQSILLSGYYIFGYGVSKIKLLKISTVLLIDVYSICIILITLLRFITQPQDNAYFSSFLSPFIILGSISIYILASHMHTRGKIIPGLSPYTLGIYLFHPVALEYVNRFVRMPLEFAAIEIIITFFLTLIITLFVVMTISKIPFLKYII